jgi:hypothetical protein
MEAGAASRPARERVAGVVALVTMTALAYLPAMRGGFIWDDDFHVTQNRLLRTWDGLRAIWLEPGAMLQYYPLTHTTLWLEWRLWELAPAGYHAVNVVLHAANASLLWLVLSHLAVPGAWVAAAVFALHPVHAESVAWITEIKNVQSGLFYLLAGLAYLHHALPVRGEASRRGLYFLALGCYACAILSKTVTCTLPVTLLLCLWWKRERLGPGDLRPLLPFLAVGAAAGAVTLLLERRLVGAQGEDWTFSALDRCLIAGRALWFYLGKLVLPTGLSFVYPRAHRPGRGDSTSSRSPPPARARSSVRSGAGSAAGRSPLSSTMRSRSDRPSASSTSTRCATRSWPITTCTSRAWGRSCSPRARRRSRRSGSARRPCGARQPSPAPRSFSRSAAPRGGGARCTRGPRRSGVTRSRGTRTPGWRTTTWGSSS